MDSKLLAGARELESSFHDRDFQRLRPGREASMRGAVILVLTRSGDVEVDRLSRACAALGVRIERVNSDGPRADIELQPVEGELTVEGRSFVPTAVWIRYFVPASIPTSADAVRDAFARDSWYEMCVAIRDTFTDLAVNARHEPGTQCKARHLRAASKAGFRVPRTRMTTTYPVADLAPQQVVKTMGTHFVEATPGIRQQVYPLVLDAGADPMADVAPVIVQEWVESAFEVRCFVVGDDVVAYRPAPDEASPTTFTTFAVSQDLHERLTRFVRDVDLDMAACDLLILPGGECVFLEANPVFDWSYWETRVDGHDTRVSEMILHHLGVDRSSATRWFQKVRASHTDMKEDQ